MGVEMSNEAQAVIKLVKRCLHDRDPEGLEMLCNLVTRWSTTLTPEDVVDLLNTALDEMPEDVRRWWFFSSLNAPDGGNARDN